MNTGIPEAFYEFARTYESLGEVTIYGLVDPIDEQLRYIGRSQDVCKRYLSHIKNSFTNDREHPKSRWIRSLVSQELWPILIIIDHTTHEEKVEDEIFYMQYFRFIGCDLLNYDKIFSIRDRISDFVTRYLRI